MFFPREPNTSLPTSQQRNQRGVGRGAFWTLHSLPQKATPSAWVGCSSKNLSSLIIPTPSAHSK